MRSVKIMNTMLSVVAGALIALPAAADAPAWSSGTYHYDGAGNIKKVGNDVYRYDPYGRLKTATAGTTPFAPSTPPVNQQAFTYDQYGNLKTLTTTTAAGTLVRGFAVDETTNQLDGACTGTVDICLMGFYDAASGNQVGLDATGQYTYDALGMMTANAKDGQRRHIYDVHDERIVTIDVVGGSTAHYTLRGVDNKVTRALTFVPATSTWSLAKDYVYRGGALTASFSGSGQTHPDLHYHLDHLGSTRLITDGTAQRLAAHTYWPFGLEADGSESDPERLKFTGHERDTSNDGFVLDYMHARYYDPNLGRFLTVDPVLGHARSPQSLNRYTYVMNNPVALVDPTGLYTVDCGSMSASECLKQTNAFQKALNGQRSSKDDEIAEAAGVYGALGDANGVVVTFVPNLTNEGNPVHGTHRPAFGADGATGRIDHAIQIKAGLDASSMALAAVHEGKHALTANAFGQSVLANAPDDSLNLSMYDAEMAAYLLSARFVQANQTNNGQGVEYNGLILKPMTPLVKLRNDIDQFLRGKGMTPGTKKAGSCQWSGFCE